jgi:integrase/recombinase XerD
VTTVAIYDAGSQQLATVDPVTKMLGGFMAQYLNKPQTWKAYTADLQNYLSYCQQHDLNLMLVTRADLDMYVAWMQQHPRNWSESTIARRIGTVCQLYKYGAEEELLLRNPASRVNRPKVDHSKQRCTFLPPVEFATLLKYVNRHGDPMEQAYIALLGLRGLRIAEACSLNVEDFREERGYRTLRFIGKGGKARLVQVPAPAVRPLERAIGDRATGPLLLNQHGRRMNRVNGDAMLKRLALAAGVDTDISNHSLRRSFVTAAKASGESYDDIAETVGHASTSTTRKYDRLIGALDRDISGSVAGFLSNLAG